MDLAKEILKYWKLPIDKTQSMRERFLIDESNRSEGKSQQPVRDFLESFAENLLCESSEKIKNKFFSSVNYQLYS
jgi:hypothetical protein